MKQVHVIQWARTGEIFTGKGFSHDSDSFRIYSNEVDALAEIRELCETYKGQPIALIKCYITPRTN